MAEETESLGENLQDSLTKLEQFVEDNQRAVLIGGATLTLVVVALVYFFVKWLPDENLKAQKAMYQAEFSFARDSFAVALNGNQNYKGFADVASKYSMTKSGKLANYYAGLCCLNLKNYDGAIKYLDKFSSSDAIIGAMKYSALGDAYMEKGNTEEGVKNYEKAANFSDNENYTPYFLFKTGMAYEKLKKFADAKKQYEKIKDKYPMSDEGKDIDKYLARASAGSN
jgi:tetratricopeptide (TPR) repeat protein